MPLATKSIRRLSALRGNSGSRWPLFGCALKRTGLSAASPATSRLRKHLTFCSNTPEKRHKLGWHHKDMNRSKQYPTRRALTSGELLRLPFQVIMETKTYFIGGFYSGGWSRMPVAEQEITA